jgi:opacity protein-like surface antigen
MMATMERRGNFITRTVSLAVVVVALFAGPAGADDGQGAIASGTVSAAAIESGTKTAVAGAVGYRFNRAIGFQVEVTWIPTIPPDVTALGGSTIVTPAGAVGSTTSVAINSAGGISPADGRAVVFATAMRIEIPTTTRRVIPYVVGGGGVASLREAFTITFPRPLLPTGVPVPNFPVFAPQTVTQASTDLALTLGGGASLLATDHLSIDADLRYFRLLGTRDLNVGRFGLGASWRF